MQKSRKESKTYESAQNGIISYTFFSKHENNDQLKLGL